MYTVMIVDDMEIIRRRLKRMKIWGEASGFQVVAEAANGCEALKKLQAAPVDLVITDIRMPKMDGIELLHGIKEEGLCPCVVLISDYGDFDYVRQGFLQGAFDYLMKSLGSEELLRTLQRALPVIRAFRSETPDSAVPKTDSAAQEGLSLFGMELQHMIKLVEDRSSDLVHYAGQTAEHLSHVLAQDQRKATGILKQLLQEIVHAAFARYGWLRHFTDVDRLLDPKLLLEENFEAMKAGYLRTLRNMMALIAKLLCVTPDNSLPYRICTCALEHADGELSASFIASTLYMNKTYIGEVFKQKTGIALVEYLTLLKMERAKKLMADETLKIYEVGSRLGYQDVEYFSRVFKRYTGQTPTNFRKLHTISSKV